MGLIIILLIVIVLYLGSINNKLKSNNTKQKPTDNWDHIRRYNSRQKEKIGI